MTEPTDTDVDRLARLITGGSENTFPAAEAMARRLLEDGVTLPEPEPPRCELSHVEDTGGGVVLWFEWEDEPERDASMLMAKSAWLAVERHVANDDRLKLAVLDEKLREARKERDDAMQEAAEATRAAADPDVLAAHAKGVFDGLHVVTEGTTSHCALAEGQPRPRPNREQVLAVLEPWFRGYSQTQATAAADAVMAIPARAPLFRARVGATSGGGVVNLLVHRGTEEYPAPGRAVEVYEAQA